MIDCSSQLSLICALILLCHIVWLSPTFTVCLTDSHCHHPCVDTQIIRLLCLLCVCWLDQRHLFSLTTCVHSHIKEFIHTLFIFQEEEKIYWGICTCLFALLGINQNCGIYFSKAWTNDLLWLFSFHSKRFHTALRLKCYLLVIVPWLKSTDWKHVQFLTV